MKTALTRDVSSIFYTSPSLLLFDRFFRRNSKSFLLSRIRFPEAVLLLPAHLSKRLECAHSRLESQTRHQINFPLSIALTRFCTFLETSAIRFSNACTSSDALVLPCSLTCLTSDRLYSCLIWDDFMGFTVYQVFEYICTNVFRFAVWITTALVVVGAGVVVVFSSHAWFTGRAGDFWPTGGAENLPWQQIFTAGSIWMFFHFPYLFLREIKSLFWDNRRDQIVFSDILPHEYADISLIMQDVIHPASRKFFSCIRGVFFIVQFLYDTGNWHPI